MIDLDELIAEARRRLASDPLVMQIVDALVSVRAERDAALAAIERVVVLHEFDDGYCKTCAIPFHECDTAMALIAALDGASEPEEKP